MSQEQQQIFPYLQRLLNGATVEWKSLGEVVKTITPPGKIKGSEYQLKGVLPIIDQGIELIGGYTDNTSIALPKEQYIIFGDHSEHIKYIDYSFVQGADGLKILTTDKAIPKYIYYAFTNNYQKEGKYKRHWSTAKETIIPIPPMEVQERIVEILDKFTELQTELQTELTLREKQYIYFRDQLLSQERLANKFADIKHKMLGDVVEMYRGKRLVRKDLQEKGLYSVYQNSMTPLGYYDKYNTEPQTTFIIAAGSAGEIGFSSDPFWLLMMFTFSSTIRLYTVNTYITLFKTNSIQSKAR